MSSRPPGGRWPTPRATRPTSPPSRAATERGGGSIALSRPRSGIDPWALLAAGTFLALIFVALFGERLAPHEPIYFVVEHERDPRPNAAMLIFSAVVPTALFTTVSAAADILRPRAIYERA